MTFFSKFPTIEYQASDQTRVVCDILTATLPKRLRVDQSMIFQNYVVKDGQRPEDVAEELYKDPLLHWTILLVNNIVNPFIDWPMDALALEEFALKKYGSTTEIHHFEDVVKNKVVDDFDFWFFSKFITPQPRFFVSTGADDIVTHAADSIVSSFDGKLPEHIRPVTNLQYEIELNDKRRFISVVSKSYVNRFVEEFNKSIESQ